MFTLLVGCALATDALPPDDPSQIVRAWLDRGSRDELEGARALVEARCHDTPVGRVAPVRFLGAPLTIDKLEVQPATVQGNTARVAYALTGSIQERDTTTETRILGKPVSIEVKGLTVDVIESSGSVDLVRTPTGWLVTCAETPG